MIDEPVVLDANVALRAILPEEGSEAARGFLEELGRAGTSTVAVPDLFFAECGSVLRRQVIRKGMGSVEAEAELRCLAALDFDVVPSRDLAVDAFALAREHRISFFDACYVAVAERNRATLVTADGRLHRALAGTRHRVALL